MTVRLASESTFRRIADTLLSASDADDTFVSFLDSESTTLRFANDQVVQHVSVREPTVSARAAFGRKVGSARTNRLDNTSLIDMLRNAERIARFAPDDPEYLTPLPRQSYTNVPTFRESTASTSPIDLARRTRPVIDKCVRNGLVAAGIMAENARPKASPVSIDR